MAAHPSPLLLLAVRCNILLIPLSSFIVMMCSCLSVLLNAIPLMHPDHTLIPISSYSRFWSTVFHVHDYPVTERMDYFSASSVVLFNLYAILIRLLDDFILSNGKGSGSSRETSITQLHSPSASPSSPWSGLLNPHSRIFLFLAIGVGFAAFFWQHVSYMAFKYFDYGYNMKVNIAMGMCMSVCLSAPFLSVLFF